MECGRAWFHRLVRHLERRSGPLVLGLRSYLSHSAGHPERSPRAYRVRSARSRRRYFRIGIFQGARLSAAAPAIAGALDPLLSTGVGRIARWSHRLLRLSPSDGPRVWGNGPGHAWPIRVAVAGRSRAVQNSGDYIIVFERHTRRHVRAYAFYRSDARRSRGLL